ncbi:MAG: hypothetical protein K2M11_09220 [Paramuribaculum sp.]|nr:hypothetical protein [Paramuribaculum sp.]
MKNFIFAMKLHEIFKLYSETLPEKENHHPEAVEELVALHAQPNQSRLNHY